MLQQPHGNGVYVLHVFIFWSTGKCLPTAKQGSFQQPRCNTNKSATPTIIPVKPQKGKLRCSNPLISKGETKKTPEHTNRMAKNIGQKGGICRSMSAFATFQTKTEEKLAHRPLDPKKVSFRGHKSLAFPFQPDGLSFRGWSSFKGLAFSTFSPFSTSLQLSRPKKPPLAQEPAEGTSGGQNVFCLSVLEDGFSYCHSGVEKQKEFLMSSIQITHILAAL